ncbi:hypothetical protein JRC04_07210 [Mycolicibacterium sp. S2-37]|uniref:hypothetical protein n=1 Tax=Mycolicibacterium sp. S2-37 TaxID=2810297 RepID=UPI001A94A05F|nr:hypothetical protein [Mycolicibacterium sp. S2-37]MBO0677248.1 hypothetical protein [Mycolicibacterium sp. S2-37]
MMGSAVLEGATYARRTTMSAAALPWALFATELRRLRAVLGDARALAVVGSIADALRPAQVPGPELPPMWTLVDRAKTHC